MDRVKIEYVIDLLWAIRWSYIEEESPNQKMAWEEIFEWIESERILLM